MKEIARVDYCTLLFSRKGTSLALAAVLSKDVVGYIMNFQTFDRGKASGSFR